MRRAAGAATLPAKSVPRKAVALALVDSASSRPAAWSRPWVRLRPWPILMAGCTLLTAWLVFVPLAALFYTAFSEDTPFGPGDLSLANFARAYVDNHILLLLQN